MTPTARSLAHLRKLGYVCDVVERNIPHAFIKKDMGGFADIVAWGNGEIVAVQTTSGSNVASRKRKILDSDNAHAWVKAGGIIALHGWSKKGPRGKRKLWQLTEEVLVP